MVNPHKVLGLSPESSEGEVRRRYLELVRQYPPDRHPARFTEIREAYDQLRDPQKRLESRLFSHETSDSLPAIAADVRQRVRAARIPTNVLLSLAEKQ